MKRNLDTVRKLLELIEAQPAYDSAPRLYSKNGSLEFGRVCLGRVSMNQLSDVFTKAFDYVNTIAKHERSEKTRNAFT